MRSIAEPDWDTEFKIVYFDEKGSIKSLENRVDENSTYHYAYFLFSDLVGFIDGTKRTIDYKVVYHKDTLDYSIELAGKKKYSTTNNLNILSKVQKCYDPEVVVQIKENEITFTATHKLSDFFVDDESDTVILGMKSHPFYIILKDEPNFLLDTLNIEFSKLLTGREYTINYEHKYDISIYTKSIFNKYSLGEYHD